ncbi:hypothetical protein PMAYCL1PPCAC_15162, partial [Pristionchus mayeri]
MSGEQCDSFRHLSASLEYQVLIATKCVACIFGAIAIAYQWIKLGVRFLVHDNTKIIFTIFYALHLYITVNWSILYFLEITRLRFDCFIINFRTVLLTKGMGISAVSAAHNVILIVSFERFYAIFFPSHFEKHSNKRLTLCISISVVLFFNENAASLFMSSIDFYVNYIRKPSTIDPSLSVSYQRNENRRVILIILPIEITQSLLSFF